MVNIPHQRGLIFAGEQQWKDNFLIRGGNQYSLSSLGTSKAFFLSIQIYFSYQKYSHLLLFLLYFVFHLCQLGCFKIFSLLLILKNFFEKEFECYFLCFSVRSLLRQICLFVCLFLSHFLSIKIIQIFILNNFQCFSLESMIVLVLPYLVLTLFNFTQSLINFTLISRKLIWPQSIAQIIQRLPNMHGALGSTPSTG